MEPTGQEGNVSENHWQIVERSHLIKSDTPKALFQNGLNFFKWCDENPIIEEIPIRTGKGAGTSTKFKRPRPYTLKGLCLHCNVTEEYLSDVRKSKLKDSEYYVVISKLLYLIYVQNQELAIAGVFNGIFVSKVLNMEKEETPVHAIKVELVNGLPELAENENDILEKLDYDSEKSNDA